MAIQFNLEEKRTSNISHVLLNYFFLPFSVLYTRDRKKISAIGNCSLSIGFYFLILLFLFSFYVQKLFKWKSTLECFSFRLMVKVFFIIFHPEDNFQFFFVYSHCRIFLFMFQRFFILVEHLINLWLLDTIWDFFMHYLILYFYILRVVCHGTLRKNCFYR